MRKKDGSRSGAKAPTVTKPSRTVANNAVCAGSGHQIADGDAWDRDVAKAREVIWSYLAQSKIPADAIRALRLMDREAGTGDFEFGRMILEFVSSWRGLPPAEDHVLAWINEFRDSPDAVEDVEWVTETADWSFERVPISKGGTVYGYVREDYWTALNPEVRERFQAWIDGHDLSKHDEWLLRNALLFCRIRTAEGFREEINSFLLCATENDE